MTDIQFYCQSTVQNYLFIFIIILASILFLVLFKLLNKIKEVSSYTDKVKNLMKKYSWIFLQSNNSSKHLLTWCWLHLFVNFLFISIVEDLIMLLNHVVLSFCTILLFFMILIYLIKIKFVIFTPKYIKEMYSLNMTKENSIDM